MISTPATIASAALLLVVSAIAIPAAAAEGEPDTNRKAVLVTGASSGIGRKITELLAAEGHHVYAGARKQKDLDDLNAIDNIQAIKLDVTVHDEIQAAVKAVEAGGLGLHGLVNNAGVAILAPLAEAHESEIDFLFDVNVYGPYRMTRAFAPLIVASKGRISNISSISGILSGPLYGPYSMSKHAVEAYTDSLAREMKPLGVHVSAVEPGNYDSKIGQSFCQRVAERPALYEASLFKEEMARGLSRCDQDTSGTSPQPDAVAEAVLHALFDAHPKEHYLVVPEQQQAGWTIRKALEEVVRLNEGHQFSYSRDELVEMLDQMITPQTDP